MVFLVPYPGREAWEVWLFRSLLRRKELYKLFKYILTGKGLPLHQALLIAHIILLQIIEYFTWNSLQHTAQAYDKVLSDWGECFIPFLSVSCYLHRTKMNRPILAASAHLSCLVQSHVARNSGNPCGFSNCMRLSPTDCTIIYWWTPYLLRRASWILLLDTPPCRSIYLDIQIPLVWDAYICMCALAHTHAYVCIKHKWDGYIENDQINPDSASLMHYSAFLCQLSH